MEKRYCSWREPILTPARRSLGSMGSAHLSGKIQQEQTRQGTCEFWLMAEFPVVVRRGSALQGTEPGERYSGKGSGICATSCNESSPLC